MKVLVNYKHKYSFFLITRRHWHPHQQPVWSSKIKSVIDFFLGTFPPAHVQPPDTLRNMRKISYHQQNPTLRKTH